jgi:hypothetical protein
LLGYLLGEAPRRATDGEPQVFDASKLHVTLLEGTRLDGPLAPRRYTLTHSDVTGDLFLSIGPVYDRRALSALQVRLERDEVLGEWVLDEKGPRLELHMMAQGGLPFFGTAKMRCEIFRHYRSMVLGAIRHADRALADAHPELDNAPVIARFHWRGKREEAESWDRWSD